MKSSRSLHNFFALLTATAVGLLAVYAFMYWDIHRKHVEIAEAIAEIEALQENENELRATEDILEDTKDEIAELENRFVGNQEVVPFIEFMERLARSHGLDVDITSVDEKELEGNTMIEYLVMEMSVKGSFVDVLKFIKLVETMPYKVELGPVKTKQIFIKNEIGDTFVSWESRMTLSVLKVK